MGLEEEERLNLGEMRARISHMSEVDQKKLLSDDNPEKPNYMKLPIFAKHPLTSELLPIYAAEYVIEGYGTGAVMGVPGHDKRDEKLASFMGIESI